MRKQIFRLVLAALGAFLGYVALLPADYTIAREVKIPASPETIFPFINNSKKVNNWMPWAALDPKLKMTYSGPEEGVGAVSSWDSAGQMGIGRAEVIESVPNVKVRTQLTYTKPMEMTQVAEMSLTPSDGGTLVRWSVAGRNNFIGRIFCVLINMDKVVGSEFEKGLAKLAQSVHEPAESR